MINKKLWEAIKSSLLVGFTFAFFGFGIAFLSGGSTPAKVVFSIFCFIFTFFGALLTTIELDALDKDE